MGQLFKLSDLGGTPKIKNLSHTVYQVRATADGEAVKLRYGEEVELPISEDSSLIEVYEPSED